MRQLICIIASVFLAACTSIPDDWKKYKFGPYTLYSPLPIIEKKVQGVDSWVGVASIGEDIEISFDVGMYSGDFDELRNKKGFVSKFKRINNLNVEFASMPDRNGYLVGLFAKTGDGPMEGRYNLIATCKTIESKELAQQIIENVEF